MEYIRLNNENASLPKFLVLPWQGVKPVCDVCPRGHNVSFPESQQFCYRSYESPNFIFKFSFKIVLPDAYSGNLLKNCYNLSIRLR